MEKRKELFLKLKRVADVYKVANNEQRIRLFDSCKVLFQKLEEEGVPRVFSETLVIGGRDFVETLDGGEADEYSVKVIFGC